MKKNQLQDETLEYLSMPEARSRRKKSGKTSSVKRTTTEIRMMQEIESRYADLYPKKGKKKRILSAIFLVALCAVSVYVMYELVDAMNDGNQASLVDMLRNMNVGYFVVGMCLFAVIVLLDSGKFAYINKVVQKKFRPVMSFKLAVLGKYYDNITPLATGGQPFQIHYLLKKDVPAGVATAIPLIKYFINMFAWLIVCIVLFAFAFPASVSTPMKVAAIFGLVLNSLLPTFLIIFSVLPRFATKLAKFVVGVGVKLKLVKDREAQLNKAFKLVDDFKSSLRLVSKGGIHIIALLLICIAETCVTLTIPYFLCVALGGVAPGWSRFIEIVALNAVAIQSVSFIPTPGNAGFAESSAALVFKGINLTEGTLFWIVLIWRILNYYLFILLGIIVIAVDYIRNRFTERFVAQKRISTMRKELEPQLNSPDYNERIAALRILKSLERQDKSLIPRRLPNRAKFNQKSVFSGASYYPANLVYHSYREGCSVCGVIDTLTTSSGAELSEACAIVGITPLYGVELPVRSEERRSLRINSPLQRDLLNIYLLGVPECCLEELNERLAEKRELRIERMRKMTEILNNRIGYLDIRLDFDQEILPLSKAEEGGALSEQHILRALCDRLIAAYGMGAPLLEVLSEEFEIVPPVKAEKNLLNVENPNYRRDLTAAMQNLVKEFYVDAHEECFAPDEIGALAKSCGGVIAYPYIGDIEQTLHGETVVEKFEDGFLEPLLERLREHSVRAVCYRLTSNTPEQIERVRELCKRLELMEISAGATLSRKQQDNTFAAGENSFAADCMWAVAGNSHAHNAEETLFSDTSCQMLPALSDRIAVFSSRGRSAG